MKKKKKLIKVAINRRLTDSSASTKKKLKTNLISYLIHRTPHPTNIAMPHVLSLAASSLQKCW